MNKNSNIKNVPYYYELVDLLAEVYRSLNGDYPDLKNRIREFLERTEPQKLYEEYR